ncbi:MAG: hypothetical protein H0T64_04640, partial [Pyrinomonadaceae bacterium]|nr:hypothetical protein [Pyrinomonadaceae bacterium]
MRKRLIIITAIVFALLAFAGSLAPGGGPTRGARAATSPCPYPLTEANRPVAPATAPAESA